MITVALAFDIILFGIGGLSALGHAVKGDSDVDASGYAFAVVIYVTGLVLNVAALAVHHG